MLCNAHIDVCIDMYIYIYSYILLFQPHCGEEYPHEDIHMGHTHTHTDYFSSGKQWLGSTNHKIVFFSRLIYYK